PGELVGGDRGAVHVEQHQLVAVVEGVAGKRQVAAGNHVDARGGVVAGDVVVADQGVAQPLVGVDAAAAGGTGVVVVADQILLDDRLGNAAAVGVQADDVVLDDVVADLVARERGGRNNACPQRRGGGGTLDGKAVEDDAVGHELERAARA